MQYGHERVVDYAMGDAIDRVIVELAARGFGVLSTIDVQATLKEKIDVERRPYVILGACNPNFAHQALQFEEALGLLLPCNVVVYENADDKTVIAVIDARAMLAVVGNPELNPIAAEVNTMLKAAIDAV